MKRGIIILLITVLAAALIALRLKANKTAQAEEVRSDLRQPPPKVRAAVVGYQEVSETIAAVGTVEAGQTVVLQSETDGKVRRLHFIVGDKVAKGQLLVETHASQKRIGHQLNELTYQKTLRDYERLRALYQEHKALIQQSVVVLTTSENGQDYLEARHWQVKDYLVKPLTLEKMTAFMQRHYSLSGNGW